MLKQATHTLDVSSWLQDFVTIVLSSLLIAFCAPIAIPLPFTPIPLAIGPHLCLALGAILGSRRGAMAVMTYLAQGLAGLPVFALGGSGLATLLGPSGGYLVGCLIASYVVGFLIETLRERTPWKILMALIVGNSIIYFFGALQLAFFVGGTSALMVGVLPFLAGDAWKLIVLTRFIPKLVRCP